MDRFEDYYRDHEPYENELEIFWNYHVAQINAMAEMINDLAEKVDELEGKLKDK